MANTPYPKVRQVSAFTYLSGSTPKTTNNLLVNTRAGNGIIVLVTNSNGSFATPQVQDNINGVYNVALKYTEPAGGLKSVGVFYLQNGAGGNLNITYGIVSGGNMGNDEAAIIAYEVEGIARFGTILDLAFTANPSGLGDSGNPAVTVGPTSTLAQANELAFALTTVGDSAGANPAFATFPAPTGAAWTRDGYQLGTGSYANSPSIFSHVTTSATTALSAIYQPTYNTTPNDHSGYNASGIVSFKGGGAPTIIQQVQGASATTFSVTFPNSVTVGSIVLVAVSCWNGASYNAVITDNKGHDYTVHAGNVIDNNRFGTGYRWVQVATGGSSFQVTATFSGVHTAITIMEISQPDSAILDVAETGYAPNNVTWPSNIASVTLPATTYTDNLIVAWLTSNPQVSATESGTLYREQQYVGASPLNLAQTVSSLRTTSTGVYTPTWNLGGISYGGVYAIAFRGVTVNPTINSVDKTTPKNGDSVTINCLNTGASQGTITLGGIPQTITGWSTSSVTFTVNRGTNKYGVEVDLVLTTAGALTSNTFTGITSILPQTGWAYVSIGTPDSTASHRITTTSSDLATGDQVAYNTVSGTVTVATDGTFYVTGATTSFACEVWTSPDGWGTQGTQTVATQKDASVNTWLIKKSSDTKYYSNYPNGDHP